MSIAYGILCILVPCICYQIILVNRCIMKKYLWIHMIEVYVLLIYFFLIFHVTGIASIWDVGKYDELIRVKEINLILFQSKEIMPYILNMIMFIPFGFLFPMIWKTFRKFPKTLLIGMIFSLLIEICQLFNHRNTDIDDLCMNTLGVCIGYLLWKLLKKSLMVINEKCILLSNVEPYVYLILSFVGEFFLYNWRIFTT